MHMGLPSSISDDVLPGSPLSSPDNGRQGTACISVPAGSTIPTGEGNLSGKVGTSGGGATRQLGKLLISSGLTENGLRQHFQVWLPRPKLGNSEGFSLHFSLPFSGPGGQAGALPPVSVPLWGCET